MGFVQTADDYIEVAREVLKTENKIEALINARLALEIPLIETK